MKDYTKYLKKKSFPIFLFHGVTQNKKKYKIRNYNKKHISKDYFYKICLALSKAGNVISMSEVYEIISKKKKLKPYSYAITFDDGFLNNLTVAAPILHKLNLSATFYVTTNFIENNFMSWVDRIERELENTSISQLSVPWGTFKTTTIKDKLFFLKNLRKILKSNCNYDPDKIADDIIFQLGKKIKLSGLSELDKKMNWNDLKFLNSKKNFTIAPHSHNHKILSFCSNENLKIEISESIKLLKNKLNSKNFHFAYPDGQKNHYNSKVISVLKKNGVKCCPTAIDGLNNPNSNPFHLKRIMVI